MRLVEGGFDGVEGVNLYIDEAGVDGGYLTGQGAPQPLPTSDDLAAQRATALRLLQCSDVAAMSAHLQISVASGTTVDLTLRLAGLPIEKGSYASDLILPPPGEPQAAGRQGREEGDIRAAPDRAA